MNNKMNTNPKVWKILAITTGGLLLLFALYIGLGRYLTKLINTRYELGQCSEVMRLVELGRRIYLPITTPAFSTTSEYYDECEMYGIASKAQQEENWESAHSAYENYLLDYPEGVMSIAAQENAAQMLLNLAKEEFETQQYAEAVDHLTQFLEESSTSPMAEDARGLLPMCHLEWGKTLLDDQKFADALEKFELATEAGVHPDDPSGPSSQARNEIPNLHHKWADFLVSEGNFDEAEAQYQTYIAIAAPEEKTLAQESLVKGYLQWVSALSNDEDFWGALDKISLAESNSPSDKVMAEIEKTRTDTYTAFAASSGTQAHQIMDETAKNLIENKQIPELPIFGIESQNIRIYIYGKGKNASNVGNRISKDIIPQAPGEMHYVAYVSEGADATGSCSGVEIDPFGRLVTYTYVLYTHHWVTELIDIDTGVIIERRGVYGSSPHCTSKSRSDLFGGKPQLDDLETWLRTFIK